MTISRPRGTSDFLPKDMVKWHYIENILRELCREFGYEELRTPIFEDTDLFRRGVGDTTDIVQKEMYTFEDAGGRSITLRPENTASAVRAYLENKMYADVQPTKVYYIGPMFRYERPQAGRFRQFHQFGVEVFGAQNASADAEIIALAWEFYRRLGITGLEVHLNSVGCPNCRPQHRKQLQDFLRPNLDKLCPTCQGRFEKNPMRIFDCKSEVCQSVIADAPTTLDCLCDECREHFESVKAYLDAVGIPYVIDNHLVRGLDYYTKTAFEIIMNGIGAQTAVCGGGRYDGLMQEIGASEKIPGVGFALGMERIFSALKQAGIELEPDNSKDVFISALGEKAELAAFKLANELRMAGIAVVRDDLSRSLKAQMKYGAKFGVKYTIIIGDDELQNGQVVLRDMNDSTQQNVSLNDVCSVLQEKLK